jgi:MoaA/NifB/PqqE/SkfB family radical SAM enzyme
MLNNSLRVLAWETTRACTLACPHCRASAVTERNDEELSVNEAFLMLESAAKIGPAIII